MSPEQQVAALASRPELGLAYVPVRFMLAAAAKNASTDCDRERALAALESEDPELAAAVRKGKMVLQLVRDPQRLAMDATAMLTVSSTALDGHHQAEAASPLSTAAIMDYGFGNAPSRTMSPRHALLRRQIWRVGGTVADVDACPFEDPESWPVNDVALLQHVWQAKQQKQTDEDADNQNSDSDAEDEGDTEAHQRSYRDWLQRLRFAADVAAAVAYLHAFRPPLLHRDIKSLNVFIYNDKSHSKSENGVRMRAQLGDFGDCRPLRTASNGGTGNNSSSSSGSGSKSSNNGSATPSARTPPPMTGDKGTPQWMAPEVIVLSSGHSNLSPEGGHSASSRRGRSDVDYTAETSDNGFSTVLQRGGPAASYDQSADVFSLSVVLWEILTGSSPFLGLRRAAVTRTVAHWHARMPIPTVFPRALGHLLRCAWHPQSSLRPPSELVARVLERLYAAALALPPNARTAKVAAAAAPTISIGVASDDDIATQDLFDVRL